MKIELIEQLEPFSDSPWYGVKVNGTSIKWTREKEVAEAIYNEILADPDLLKTKENILQSQEVEVSLDK